MQDSHSPIKNEEVRLALQGSCKKDHNMMSPNPKCVKPAQGNSSLSLGGLLDNQENEKQVQGVGATGTNRARLDRKADEIKQLKKRA